MKKSKTIRLKPMKAAKRFVMLFCTMSVVAIGVAVAGCSDNTENNPMGEGEGGMESTTNKLGAVTPQTALEYMKATKDLLIVDVATAREYEEKHFDGAIHIHYTEMAERYNEIPQNSTVLLHCRLGMVVPTAYRMLLEKRSDLKEVSYIDGAPLFDEYNTWKRSQEEENGGDDGEVQKLLGGLSPSDALEYMKTTKELVIVEVREPQWIGSSWFEGAIRIPWSEMEQRYAEIPANRPVILNCGAGQMAPRAYKTLTEKRPDIPQLSYIAGAPLFSEYNNWLKEQNK